MPKDLHSAGLKAMNVQGEIRHLRYGKHGGINGVILADGIIVRFSRETSRPVAPLLKIGQGISASGYGTKNPHGQAFEATVLGPWGSLLNRYTRIRRAKDALDAGYRPRLKACAGQGYRINPCADPIHNPLDGISHRTMRPGNRAAHTMVRSASSSFQALSGPFILSHVPAEPRSSAKARLLLGRLMSA